MTDTPKATGTEISMHLGDLEEGILVERANRFLALVNLRGRAIEAHVADSGRLKELLFPGNRVMVRKAGSPNRKTSHDLVLAAFGDIWVCVDTRYPNRLFELAAKQGALDAFKEYTSVRREVTLNQVLKRVEGAKGVSAEGVASVEGAPKSRFDFLLEGPRKPPLLVEVKSVTLCVDGKGLFPDAPTLRGARHLNEMKQSLPLGLDGCVVFIAQREDVAQVSANRETDPNFAQAIDRAVQAGVRVHAYRCTISDNHIRLQPKEVPYR